jgi:hypothetical protein
MPVIPATLEAEIRRVEVLGQIRQKVGETPISMKKKAGCGAMHVSSQQWWEV